MDADAGAATAGEDRVWGMGPRSRLLPHADAILRMRYLEKRPVAEVAAWLAARGAACVRPTLQRFLRRVLTALPDRAAQAAGVDLAVLRAVRRRLRLPPAPAARRRAPPKALPPFHARARARRVWLPSAPRVKAAPTPGPPPPPAPAPVPVPLPLRPAPASGPAEPRASERLDWTAVHDRALQKVLDHDRQIMTNYDGMVLHMKTGRRYTPEDLMAELGMTVEEADSLFR